MEEKGSVKKMGKLTVLTLVLDLLQASLSFKFEIVRKMRKLKNKEKKRRKRGEGEFRTISNLKEREACSKSTLVSTIGCVYL